MFINIRSKAVFVKESQYRIKILSCAISKENVEKSILGELRKFVLIVEIGTSRDAQAKRAEYTALLTEFRDDMIARGTGPLRFLTHMQFWRTMEVSQLQVWHFWEEGCACS